LVVLRNNLDEVQRARERGEPLTIEWALPSFFDAFLEFMEDLGVRKAIEALPDPRQDPVVPLTALIYCVFARFLMGFESFREMGDVLFRHPDLLEKLGFTIALAESGAYPSTGQIPCNVECFSEVLRHVDWTAIREILVGVVMRLRETNPKLFRHGIFLIDSNHFQAAERHEGVEQEKRVRDGEEKICVLLLWTPHGRIPVDFRIASAEAGGEGETTCGQALVEGAFATYGPGFIKEIRWDRGYLDGKWLADAEVRLGFRWVMGVRDDMAIYEDAIGLSRQEDAVWVKGEPPKLDNPRERPKRWLFQCEGLETWTAYGKPLTAVVVRDVAEGKVTYQVFVTPETKWDATQIHGRYRSRWDIEEFYNVVTVYWGLGEKLLARRGDIYRTIVSLMMLLSALLALFEATGHEKRTLQEYQRAFKLGPTHLIVRCGGWFALLRPREVNALINMKGPAGSSGNGSLGKVTKVVGMARGP